jgi:Icc-related predicted phosphoesterase
VKFTRLLCASDFHGSNAVFRKYISACIEYEIHVALVAGDLVGKAIVPLVHKGNGVYEGYMFDSKETARTTTELENLKQKISNVGFYPVPMESDEVAEINNDPQRMEALFQTVMIERLTEWMELTQKHFGPRNIPLYIIPGNDDDPVIDSILSTYPGVYNLDGKKQWFLDTYEMIGMAESNITPWHCVRDVEETVLEEKINRLAASLEKPENSIWLVHIPPYDSLLDLCPVLDKDLRIVAEGGQVLMKPVGSTSVRKAIEQYQPMLGIHGHIHEAAGMRKIGKTLCINAGSEYAEGIMRSVMVNLDQNKIKGYMPVSA